MNVMVRSTAICLNPTELKYYLIITSLHKCDGSCNVLSPRICCFKKQQT